MQHTRWMSWQVAMQWLLPQRNKRLLVLLYAGLSEGYVLKEKTRVELQALTSEGGLAKASATGGASSSAQLQQVRDRCTNTLYVCTIIGANERYAQGARMILFCSEAYQERQQGLRHFLRDRRYALEFAMDMARGTDALDTIWKSFGVFIDIGRLEELGFLVTAFSSDARFRGMLRSDPAVEEQDDIATSLSRLPIAFAKLFLRNTSDCWAVYPRRFALLVSETPAEVASCLQELAALDKAWGGGGGRGKLALCRNES